MVIEEMTMLKDIENSITIENHKDLEEFANYLGVDFEDYLEHLHPDVDFDDYSW